MKTKPMPFEKFTQPPFTGGTKRDAYNDYVDSLEWWNTLVERSRKRNEVR